MSSWGIQLETRHARLSFQPANQLLWWPTTQLWAYSRLMSEHFLKWRQLISASWLTGWLAEPADETIDEMRNGRQISDHLHAHSTLRTFSTGKLRVRPSIATCRSTQLSSFRTDSRTTRLSSNSSCWQFVIWSSKCVHHLRAQATLSASSSSSSLANFLLLAKSKLATGNFQNALLANQYLPVCTSCKQLNFDFTVSRK